MFCTECGSQLSDDWKFCVTCGKPLPGHAAIPYSIQRERQDSPTPAKGNKTEKNTPRYHLGEQRIPEGFQIFEERLEVAGVRFRREDAAAFATAKESWLELEREPDNKYDANAIKVIGCNRDFFGIKRRFVGYVPKEVSRLIVDGGHMNRIRPRLLKTYVGDQGFVEILFQLLGPKGQKGEYRSSRSARGNH